MGRNIVSVSCARSCLLVVKLNMVLSLRNCVCTCLAISGFAVLSLSMFGCERVFYYPDQHDRGSPSDEGLAFEDVHFTASDGVRLHGWFLPATGGTARATVLHLHGNAANITGHFPFVSWMPATGFNVFTVDYRGYGRSEGRVSREGTIRDARAALDYLQTRRDIDAKRIILFGQSIGGAISIALAAERRGELAAVVLDSPFTDYREIARHHILRNPVMLLIAWWFPFGIEKGHDPIDCIGRISPTPILIMHGKDDRIVPPSMGRRLFDAASEPKELWQVDATDHMEVWDTHREEAIAKFIEFCNRAL